MIRFLAVLLMSPLWAFSPAATPVCDAPVPSTTQPGYLVADPDCEADGSTFTALPGATVHTGISRGAGYRIEVPDHWNGRLVLYAHGFRGTGTTVTVSSPSLRAHYIARGFAWAASSYATNGYDVGQGVRDSYALIGLFRSAVGKPARQVLMTGDSMGGHITGVAIETYPSAFAGAMPSCGVLGDKELFDYFLDANVTAAALARVRVEFPLHPGEDYQDIWRTQVAAILPQLGVRAGAPPVLTALGREWSDVVENRSGGQRPGFEGSFAYWNTATSLAPLGDLPFLFGVYPGLTGGTANIARGNVTDNRFTVYRASSLLTTLRLNASVLRVRPTDVASPGLSGIPRIDGRPPVPVLSLHDIGDLFVPFSMEQTYAREAARNGRANLFVSRAIRGTGHCDFTTAERQEAFDDLVTWIDKGRRPGGDAVLDVRAVSAASFGCRYTRGTHAGWEALPCR
ncbi:S9 family peptidase [Actinoplanes sp. TBRC 11911]|uniref:alpha/beta hydrolase family protein n=1 Tax=Actinoplanes sp. TBRC 11911 TaxID=2729386 RepID=UPI0020071176|nr:phthalyl amidase [Actinoplanes sp. TBRC 11911]